MSNKTTEKTLRDKYFSNDIFRIGELVEDVNSGEQMKILDRGSNYVTVATESGITKKWLNEISEKKIVPETIVSAPVAIEDFELLESGQIKLFGYETRNFDSELSELVIEQFSEFDDLYSKHQIIKCLDFAIHEDNGDKKYDLIGKVEKFYIKQSIDVPFIVEVMKNDTERTRIAEILATIADVKPSKANSKTVTDSIKSLKGKYQTRNQWEVLLPFLKLAKESGLTNAMQNLPYGVSLPDGIREITDEFNHDIIVETMEENIDLVIEDLEYDDIAETFIDEEFSDELLTESLSIEARNRLSLKLKQHSPVMSIRRERALSRSASTSVLMQRARRLAEVMVKRRIFHKSAESMTRQEKERFEDGAGSRKGLIAKLAQRLVSKVRMLQTARLHHTNTPASHTHDKATSAIHHAAGTSTVGAS